MNIKTLLYLALAILPLLLASYFLFLKDPPIWPDEGTSLHMAKAILQTGKINAQNYGGIPEEAAISGIAFPPLYFYLLGIWTSIMGENIEAIRSLSLILGGITIAIFFYITKTIFGNPIISLWGALLLSFSTSISRAARFGRPEILTFVLFLLTLLISLKLLKNPKSPKLLLLAALFAALSFASHPLGLISVAILMLAIFFSSLKFKMKLIFWSLTLLILSLISAAWILTTQTSLEGFAETLFLAQNAKLIKYTNYPLIPTNLTTWNLLIYPFLALSLLMLKKHPFIALASLITFLWVSFQKESYYLLYTQPLFILLALLLPKISRVVFIVLLLIINIYIQFFEIGFYTPTANLLSIQVFDYHQFTYEIKNSLPDKPITIFLSSIPDPSLDLMQNPNYKLYQAIDPHFPLDEIRYKQALDESDYIIYTWFPHEFLAVYAKENAESTYEVFSGGYGATILKLKPKNQRI